MQKSIRIAEKEVANGLRPFLVAEIGINHNGSMTVAKKTILAAKDAGADAVKFQFFRKGLLINPYVKEGIPVIKILSKYSLTDKMVVELKEFCDKAGVLFFATPFDPGAVDILERLDVGLYKIASGDIVNPPLLERTVRTGKPILCSTGASDLREVDAAVKVLKRNKAGFCLLHCVSLYPAPLEEMNLRTVPFYAKRYGCVSGLSDHTIGSTAAEWAVGLGAAVIEKHFTLDRKLPGPDHALSMNPKELKAFREKSDLLIRAIGTEGKTVLEAELKGNTWGRRSPVCVKALKKGERLTPDHITLLRPQTGLPASVWKSLIGKRAKRDISEGTMLSREDA
jgi:sialic acid synthase SpsE